MTLDIFTLCDSYQIKVDKLSIVGIIDGIFVEALPAQHPSFCIIASVRFTKKEGGSHSFSFKMFYPNGQLMMDTNTIELSNVREMEDGSFRTVVPYMKTNLPIQAEGQHRVVIFVDGKPSGELPLFIIRG